MKRTMVVRTLSIVLCLVFAATIGAAQVQNPPKETYTPQVGQAGKDVIWVPTPESLVTKMLDLAKVTADDVVIDLGSGDGRTVIAAAKRGARATGIEYNPEMVELSKRAAEEAGVSGKATFMKADLFETDFSQATVITMFLLPDINLKLRPKILDLKPGTRIVSNSFTMGDWAEDAKATVDDCTSWCSALLWIVPAKVAGTWRLGNGELTLQQQYQMLTGTLTAGGKSTTITDARMRGDEIVFNAGSERYVGRVAANGMSGKVTGANGSAGRSWTATKVQ